MADSGEECVNSTSPMIRRRFVAVSAILMQLCLGTVYAWSIFKKPMMTANGWSETQTQYAFMVNSAMFALAVAFGGTLVDRMAPRIIGALGGIMFGTGVLLAGAANSVKSITLLIIAYGLITGLGGGFGYVTPIATLIRWFPDKRGQLTGLAVMGYGLGAFTLGNIGPALIIKYGVANTFYLWGVISLTVVFSSALTLVNPPDGWSPGKTASSSAHATILPASSSFSEAVRTPRFWILWMMLFVSITAGLGLISQLSPLAQDVMSRACEGAVSVEKMESIVIVSGTIVAIAGIFNGLGRLIWAWVSDFIGRKAVFALIFISFALGFATLAHVHTTFIFAVLCFYLLACYGGTMATMPALAADEFGPLNIGKIYGVIFTACGFAGFCGPFIFARVKELTGGFNYALYMESSVAVLGLILIIILNKVGRE
jgi:MFS transporter, OFA family, oxalate/formate antiporter